MTDPGVRIWFNRHFSTVGRVLLQLAQASPALPVWTCVSHRHANFSAYGTADHALLEPAGLDPQAYLSWCLATAQRLAITHLVPGHEQSLLTAHWRAFAEIGCTVLKAAPAEILPLLHRKEWVYAQVRDVVPLPESEEATDLDGALSAIARLRRGGEVAVKPCVSVYGKGFYRLIEDGSRAADACSASAWEALMREQGEFPAHLIMRYLPGPEYSVDIAAHEGETLAAVIRRKGSGPENIQRLVEHADIERHARWMIARFACSGLINIQFKEDRNGMPCLLEINPRASGGIGMSCLSGLNLPAIAFSKALFPAQYAAPGPGRSNLRVTEISLAVELPEPEVDPQVAAP